MSDAVTSITMGPEDPVWAGGVTDRPAGCCPRGKHGVLPPEDPWAIRACCGLHYKVVPTFEDCTPDLRREPVSVCRWGRDVIVGGVETGGAGGGHCSG